MSSMRFQHGLHRFNLHHPAVARRLRERDQARLGLEVHPRAALQQLHAVLYTALTRGLHQGGDAAVGFPVHALRLMPDHICRNFL